MRSSLVVLYGPRREPERGFQCHDPCLSVVCWRILNTAYRYFVYILYI